MRASNSQRVNGVSPYLAVLPSQIELSDTRPIDADTGSLIAVAQAGDRVAFGMLIERHYDLIFRTAYKWSGHRSDAEDITQDVCVKIGAALMRFDGRSAFATWVYKITLNAVRDMQRSRSRQGRQARALAEVSPGEFPSEQEEATLTRELWAAVRRLPEKQRDAVLLIYAEDLNHAAAADIMGCREATVSWHIHEAKKALRGLL